MWKNNRKQTDLKDRTPNDAPRKAALSIPRAAAAVRIERPANRRNQHTRSINSARQNRKEPTAQERRPAQNATSPVYPRTKHCRPQTHAVELPISAAITSEASAQDIQEPPDQTMGQLERGISKSPETKRKAQE